MRIGPVVPVEVGPDIDRLADLESFDRLVGGRILAAEIEFDAEIDDLAVFGGLEVEVVGLALCIFVGKGGAGLVVGLDGHAVKDDLLIHMFTQEVFLVENESQAIERVGHVGAVLQFEGGVNDLDLTGPLGLSAGHTDLLAILEQKSILLRAGHVVDS